MVRMEDSGLGLQDSLLTAMDYLSDPWSPEKGVIWEARLSTIYLDSFNSLCFVHFSIAIDNPPQRPIKDKYGNQYCGKCLHNRPKR